MAESDFNSRWNPEELPELRFIEESSAQGEGVGRMFACSWEQPAFQIDPEVFRLLPEHLIWRYQILPLRVEGGVLTLGMADPGNVLAIDDVRLISGYDVRPVGLDPTQLQQFLKGERSCLEVSSSPGPRPRREAPLPLQAMRCDARVSGALASVHLQQRFANGHDEPIEAVYVFPVPYGAAVHEFRMQVGDRLIEGQIQERRQARKTYVEGIKSGHRAALLEMTRDGILQATVGNLPPGEDVVVDLTYAVRLEQNDLDTTFRLPLVMAPRYEAEATEPSGEVCEVESPRLLAQSGVWLEINLELETAGLMPDFLACTAHAVSLQSGPGGVLQLRLSNQHEPLNRDFVVRFRTESSQARATLLTTEDHFLLTVMPPVVLQSPRVARDLVFLLDRSGSMQGAKLKSAQAALTTFLERLHPEDRFALIAFDTQLTMYAEGRWCDSGTDLTPARDWIAGLTAQGGTELSAALGQALSYPSGEGRLPCCILITDGQVGGEDQLLARIQQAENGMRFFTLGIDTAVNDAFLRRLAELGRGTCELLHPDEGLEASLARLNRETASIAISDLRLVDRGLNFLTDSLAPNPLPDLYACHPLHISGRKLCLLNAGGGADLVGRLPGGEDWRVTLSPCPSHNRALGVLWARDRIRQLEDRLRLGPDRKELEREIVGLALSYQLLTQHTSFVLVDRHEIVNPEGEQHRVVQPLEIPQGWDAGSVFGMSNLSDCNETVKDISASDFGPLDFEDDSDDEIALDKLRELIDESPIIRVVNLIISQALNDGATQIHYEPAERQSLVRFRVDGVLHDVMNPPRHIHAPLVARVKCMAGLDISQRLIPQLGRIFIEHEGRKYDLEASVFPTSLGERVVIQIRQCGLPARLDPQLPAPLVGSLEKALQHPGMVVVSGTAHSGVEETLRAWAVRLADQGGRSVLLWDSVHQAPHPGLNSLVTPSSMEVEEFLEHLLRQAPEVLVCTHTEADLTQLARLVDQGCTVLAPLSAPELASALARLQARPTALRSLRFVLSQVRVRRTCPDCGAQGCDRCKMCGYQGCLTLYEGLPLSMGMWADLVVNPTLNGHRQGRIITQAQRALDRSETTRSELERVGIVPPVVRDPQHRPPD